MGHEVVFVESEPPPLPSGMYEIPVTQTVKLDVEQERFAHTFSFYVSGEQFSLAEEDCNSVFPPEMSNGNFAITFPHIVFNRRTLPWERFSSEKNTWLAVLLVNEDENPPKVQKGRVADLLFAKEDILSYPNLKIVPEAGESKETLCTYIDLDMPFFQKIAPSKNDLKFLAHYRRVSTQQGEEAKGDELNCSVVIANRVGKENTKSFAYLVSLENMGSYLPDDEGTPSKNIQNKKKVRLIVLKHWEYYSNDEGNHFKKELNDLSASPLRFPVETASQDPSVQLPLQNGYLPLPHMLRTGEETLSWYRGPLVPFEQDKLPLPFPVATPDALHGYDGKMGVFDVSYAAAWQLGQLLTVENKEVSTQIYNWRKRIFTQASTKLALQNLKTKLGGNKLFEQKIESALNEKTEEPLEKEAILNWLTNLRLLNGIPFDYLVAHKEILPEKSIRFFFLDENWLCALIDGALSIGRGAFLKEAKELEDLVEESKKNLPLRDKKSSADPISGFFLRSKAVSFGPRLIINGFSKEGKELEKLKLVKLNEELLICFFAGKLDHLSLHEPFERLHFGIKELQKGKIEKREGQTIKIAKSAQNLRAQNSALFAKEMIQRSINVEFRRK